jgi:kynurenine formamidase
MISRRWPYTLALPAALVATPALAGPPPQVLVDLTHTLDEHFPFIPVEGITFPFRLSPIATLEKNHVAANAWHIHEHLGTQIDAPSHFVAGARSLDQMRLDELLAPLIVLDVRAQASLDPDYAVSVPHLQAWERLYGRIPAHAVVAMDSGWALKVSDPAGYLGRTTAGRLHFPGFSAAAIEFLVQERDVWGVGVDTISFEPSRDETFAAHRALLSADRLALEALAQLEQVPPRGATVFIGAPKVRGATGGPTRVVALYPRTLKSTARRRARQLLIALQGHWKSAAPERRGDAYLMRELWFTGARWRGAFTFYDSPRLDHVSNRGSARGRFELEPGTQEDGSTFALFAFDPGTPCPREFARLKLEGSTLQLGARPSPGDLGAPERRPSALGPPLLRAAGH